MAITFFFCGIDMAWNTITHSCGHESCEQMYGPEKDRERRKKFRCQQICPDCWRTAQEAKGPEFILRTLPAEQFEMIAHRATFAIKEDLKEHGYRFGEYYLKAYDIFQIAAIARVAPHAAANITKPEKAWGKILQGAEERNAEMLWIGSHGWEILDTATKPENLASIAFIEGRPELL